MKQPVDDSVSEIEVDGFKVVYRVAGEGPPVVFLHGFFGDHRVWRSQFELADEFKVIAWDAPGCGGSSTPPPTFAMSDYAHVLEGFIDALGIAPAHLVGNSFGGTLALELAIRRPDLVKSIVA